MCIAKIAFNSLFRPSNSSFTPGAPFSDKIMGPNFALLYNTNREAVKVVKSLEKEIIPVHTFDGLTLEGWFYSAGENVVDTAILVHGYNSSPFGDLSAIMQFYLKNGVNVLLTNNRGGKTSVGDNITFGLYERLDTALWVDKLNERFPSGSIFLHGISLGGATVCLMSELGLKNVKGVVSDCAYTSIRAEYAYCTKHVAGITPKFTLERVYKLYAKEFGNTVDDFTPLKAVAHAKCPILFIHGVADRFIPVGMARELYDACSSKKDIFLVENAGHGASYANAPKEYAQKVMEFVNANR